MLVVADANLQQVFLSTAVNRAYYAIFYAASALLATKGITRRKHSSILSEFRRHFIKTGIFDTKLSDDYGQLMDDRHFADYDLLHNISQQDTEQHVANAREFVETVDGWLRENRWI